MEKWNKKPRAVREAARKGDSTALKEMARAGARKAQEKREAEAARKKELRDSISRAYATRLEEDRPEELEELRRSTNEDTHPVDD